MHGPTKLLPALLAVGVAVLFVFVSASGVVGANPVAPAPTLDTTWSYGIVKSVSVGPQHAIDGWVYEGNATVGYTVAISETNTSATTFELTILRTMGAAVSLQFCLPSCSSPTYWQDLFYRAWESTTTLANFTTQGTVDEGNLAVPAVALRNSTISVRANLTESSTGRLPGAMGPVDLSRYLSATVAGLSTLDFSPAIGVVPTALTPGISWSSTSAFQAHGAANYSLYYHTQGPLRTMTLGPVQGPIVLDAHGNVTVAGTYSAGSTVQFGGTVYPAISLTVDGPFSVREGIIFVPAGADLFGASPAPWSGNQTATASVQQSNLDVKPSAGGPFVLAASSWRYTTQSMNPADMPMITSGTSEFAPAIAASNPVSTTTLQGQPETAVQSQSAQQCLTSGAGCPPAVGGSTPRSILGGVIVVGAVATVGALIAVALVSRRRIPPPSYPNATLYPPGASNPPALPRAPATPGTPPRPEDDPLDHLW